MRTKYVKQTGIVLVSLSCAFTAYAQSAPTPPPFVVPYDDLEVIGPFNSWASVKRDYGAVGDGVADDTVAIQNALNDLGRPGKPGALYLEPGIYRITASLRYVGNTNGPGGSWGGVSMMGESAATTKILWNGPAGAPMLIQDGGYNSRYARLTWDGNGTAGYGIAHWWDTTKNTLFDGSSEDTDEVFQDMGIGIMAGRLGGRYGQLNSEGQVRRVTFLRNWNAGVDTGSWNAVNWWIWDSHFIDCARGITNIFSLDDAGVAAGAGNFLVYRNFFERSTQADVEIGNTQWFSMHNNVSIGSKHFFYAATGSQASDALITIQGNRIVNTTDPISIFNGNLGPVLLIDNQIKSTTNQTGPVVYMSGDTAGRDITSIGNQFTVSNTIAIRDPSVDRVLSIADTVVNGETISSDPLALPATPSRSTHQVFEVPIHANAAQIQAVINAAAASSDVNPIVHLPSGDYVINQALVVPPSTRLQLVGDGLTTALWWNGSSGDAMIKLSGPSYATVRDLQFYGGQAYAISLNLADQAGGRVFIEGSATGNLQASSLVQTQLALQANVSFSGLDLSNVRNAVLIGQNIGPVSLNAGSTALMSDSWYEGSATDLFRMDSATFTFLGGLLAPASHPGGTNTVNPTILLNGFNGTATFAGAQFALSGLTSQDAIEVDAATPQTRALFLNLTSLTSGTYFHQNSQGASVGLVMAKGRSGNGNVISLPNQGLATSSFILSSLTQARALNWTPPVYQATPGSTDVRVYRVNAQNTMGMTISGQ